MAKPVQSKNVDYLNKKMKQVMMKNHWTSSDLRDEFIAVFNSFLLSGKNTATQSLIVSYLKKGLDVLNIELGMDELSKFDKATVVDASEIADEENSNQVAENKKMMQQLDEIADLKINLIKQGFTLEEATNNLRYHLQAHRTFKPLREAIQRMTENVTKSDSYKNNFATFFRMFLMGEQNWTSDNSRAIIDLVIEMIENGSRDVSIQKRYIREFDNLSKRFQNVNYFKEKIPSAKNLKVARREIARFAVHSHGWTTGNFSELFSDVLNMLINANKSDVQKFIISKISPIVKKYKSESREEQPKQEKDAPEPKKEKTTKKEQPNNEEE